MQRHDFESLNDFECWHAEHFVERLVFWRARNLGEGDCFRLARLDAQKRFPLEGEEQARLDAYIADRFGEPVQQAGPLSYAQDVLRAE